MATLSQNVAQAVSDFSSIKSAIENKGLTVPSGTPTSDYGALIENISGGNSLFIDYMNNTNTSSFTSFVIPDSITKIKQYAFYNCYYLASVTIPSGITFIDEHAFALCSALSSVVIPNSVVRIERYCFRNCSALADVTFSDNITAIPEYCFMNAGIVTANLPSRLNSISSAAFAGCGALKTLSIPSTLVSVASGAFSNCQSLEFVTLGTGLNCNRLDLSASTLYSAATIVSWFNALFDRTGQSANIFTIGSANLAKLTAEQIAIATNKNWNIA